VATAGRHWGLVGAILLIGGSAAAAVWWWEAVSAPPARALPLWPVVAFIVVAGIGLAVILAPHVGLLLPTDKAEKLRRPDEPGPG